MAVLLWVFLQHTLLVFCISFTVPVSTWDLPKSKIFVSRVEGSPYIESDLAMCFLICLLFKMLVVMVNSGWFILKTMRILFICSHLFRFNPIQIGKGDSCFLLCLSVFPKLSFCAICYRTLVRGLQRNHRNFKEVPRSLHNWQGMPRCFQASL